MKKYLTYLDAESYLFWKVEVTGRSFMESWGKVGTIGRTRVHVAASEEESLSVAESLIAARERSGYVAAHEDRIVKFALPDEMKQMFAEERTVQTEAGSFVLPSFADIKVITVVVDHHLNTQDQLSSLDGNPYQNQKGLFSATAYSLVSGAPGGNSADGLLIWLPLSGLFATWDRTNRQLYIFEGATWQDLHNRLDYYLTSAVDPTHLPNVLSINKILDSFDFIPDDIPTQVKWILSKPQQVKLAEADEFLRRYELRLLRHPWCVELEETYEALVSLYHDIGQVYERESSYGLAIDWFNRSLQIVAQSQHFKSKTFIDIFIQLSFCYFETSQFDLSLRYMENYRLYDSTANETCAHIMEAITRVRQLYEEAMASCRRAAEHRSAECYADAIRITHKALAVAPNDPLLHFNLACFYSLSFKTDESLVHLEEALKKGYTNHQRIANDRDLENTRGTNGYEAIRQKYF